MTGKGATVFLRLTITKLIDFPNLLNYIDHLFTNDLQCM